MYAECVFVYLTVAANYTTGTRRGLGSYSKKGVVLLLSTLDLFCWLLASCCTQLDSVLFSPPIHLPVFTFQLLYYETCVRSYMMQTNVLGFTHLRHFRTIAQMMILHYCLKYDESIGCTTAIINSVNLMVTAIACFDELTNYIYGRLCT